jgi:hypothetical protein
LTRASTSLVCRQGVDGRDKPGHDDGGNASWLCVGPKECTWALRGDGI